MVKVIWHSKAANEYRNALLTGYLEFGEQTSLKLNQKVEHCTKLLAHFPYIGSRVPALDTSSRQIRRLPVHELFVLYYYVDEKKAALHIVSFWNTRRNLKKLSAHT